MSSSSLRQLQDLREDEQVVSPSESTISLLGHTSVLPNGGRRANESGPLSGMNIVVTGETFA